jgi:lipopolysaccharide export LptBFGC system permease protein LptF
MIWEKHVLRLFVQPLTFCLVAFCALMLLADFIDNLHDFQENHVPVARIVTFYLNLMPSLFVKAVPLALLLATLWALLKLVRYNELVSLICAGLSLNRVLRPIMVSASALCFVTMVVNYDSAQQAEGERQAVLRGYQTKQSASVMATAVMHYHESTRRLWFVSYVPFNLGIEKLRGVQVRQFDEKGNLESSLSAMSVAWMPNGTWSFSRGMLVYYAEGTKSAEFAFNQDIEGKRRFDVSDWPETLWDIISTTQTPDLMGVPDLAGYLQTHADSADWRSMRHGLTEMWYRFALPWAGLALVLVVAAMTPMHSRRGLATYVGVSILLYMGLIFVTNVSINIARSGQLPPGVVLWLPHGLLVIAGMTLLWTDSGAPWKMRRRLQNAWRVLRGRSTMPMHPSKRPGWLNNGA